MIPINALPEDASLELEVFGFFVDENGAVLIEMIGRLFAMVDVLGVACFVLTLTAKWKGQRIARTSAPVSAVPAGLCFTEGFRFVFVSQSQALKISRTQGLLKVNHLITLQRRIVIDERYELLTYLPATLIK